jgi:4-amino-4-deoxy-L-arabinose transferase-like glycosyltransferase
VRPVARPWRDPQLLRFAIPLLVLAFAVRLTIAIAEPYELGPDPLDYDRHARSIAAGDGYPLSTAAPGGGESALRPPLYPYFLGALYAVTGQGYDMARAFQAVLGTLTVALIGLLALRLGGRRSALGAMAIAALFPPLILLDTSLATETLFLPLVLGAVLAALEARGRESLGWTLAAGALAGLAILARANGALLLLPLLLLVWPGRHAGLPGLKRPALLLAAAALAVAPWTVRNAVVMDEFIPVSLQAGYTAAGSYNDAPAHPSYPEAWRIPFADPDYGRLAERRDLKEPELEREFRQEVREHIAENPESPLEVGFWNTARFLHLAQPSYARQTAEDIGAPGWLAWAGVLAFYPLALLALAGAFTAAARRAPPAIWLAPVLFASAVFLAGFIRYRAPIDVFLIVLASFALASLISGSRTAAGRPASSTASSH